MLLHRIFLQHQVLHVGTVFFLKKKIMDFFSEKNISYKKNQRRYTNSIEVLNRAITQHIEPLLKLISLI
jgi:hypothetical protein